MNELVTSPNNIRSAFFGRMPRLDINPCLCPEAEVLWLGDHMPLWRLLRGGETIIISVRVRWMRYGGPLFVFFAYVLQ